MGSPGEDGLSSGVTRGRPIGGSLGVRLLLGLALALMLQPPGAQAQASGPLCGPTSAICWPQGSVTVAEAGRGRLIRLFPQSPPEVVAEGVRPWGVAALGDRLYFSDPEHGTLFRLEGAAPVPVASGLGVCTGLATRADRLLVVERGGRLCEVNPVDGAVRVLATGLTGAECVAPWKDFAFVSVPVSDRVLKVDLRNGSVQLFSQDVDLPVGLAVWGDRLLVASADSGTVWDYALDRKHAGERRQAGQLRPGLTGLAVYNPGGLPVPMVVGANLLDGSVTLLDSRSGRIWTQASPGLEPAGSLRFELEDRLFASGFSQAELSKQGEVVHGPLLRALYGPERVWGVVDSVLDADGTVIYTLTDQGRVVSGWGASPRVLAEGLSDPGGVTVDNQGVVFVAEAGSGRVVAILGGGEVLAVGTDLGQPVDLTWLPGQGLAVVDARGGRLLLLGSEGQKVLREGLNGPSAVCRLPEGDLAVLEAGSGRVLRVGQDGSDRGLLLQTDPFPAPTARWRVLGGLAVDPVANLLYVALPGRHAWQAVPLPR